MRSLSQLQRSLSGMCMYCKQQCYSNIRSSCLTLLGVFPCIHTQACMPGQAHTEEESALPSCSSRLSQLQQCVFAGDKQHGAPGGQSRPSNFVCTS